jgi:glutathione synthase/RimK-type ligase-like ATP-grasp enzyme
LHAIELPDGLADRCLGLAQGLELTFAGIELKLTPDNQAYCLEVNPSPACSLYEAYTGQPIAQAVVRYLSGESG